MAKSISVLIPTLGREKEVIDTVASLLKQTRVPDEIVVVNQNGDRFPELNRYLDSVSIVRHVHAPTPGVSVNYNRCLENSKGDVVLYLDDDVVPDPELIEMHLRNYEEDPELGGVAGRVENAIGDIDPERIRHVGTFHPWSGTASGNFNFKTRCEVQFAQGVNMSFSRKALLAVGGFDRGFDGNGYYFETDGGLRVRASGYRMIFDPRAQLYHLMASSGGARVKDKAAHTYFFVKNGVRLVRRHSPWIARPVCYLRLLAYFTAKAGYNADPRIFTRGCVAFFRGLTESSSVDGIQN